MPQRLFLKFTLSIIVLIQTTAIANEKSKDLIANINLQQLRETGYKIDWVNISDDKILRVPTLSNESLYAIDQEDFLNRFELNSGKWLWSAPIGNQVFNIHSIIESNSLVYVLTDSIVYAVEKTTGNRPSKRRDESRAPKHQLNLSRLATSPSISVDSSIVYGSSNGDTVWFNPEIGFTENRYKTGKSVHVRPTLVTSLMDGEGRTRKAIVSASTDGNITAVDAHTIRKLWDIKLLGSVEAPVSFITKKGSDKTEITSVFIGGTDQYIRSVDFNTGLLRWKTLTTAPLIDTPFTLRDAIYQRIPGVGLAKFEAFPESILGKQLWLNPEIGGIPITTNRDGHIVSWDQTKRALQIIEPKLGGLVSTLNMPTVKTILTDKAEGGSLYVFTNENAILRFVLRR